MHYSHLSAGGFEPPNKFSEMEAIDRISIFRAGLLGKRGSLFLRMGRGGGAVFFVKNKIKYEILMTKNVYKQKCFSLP